MIRAGTFPHLCGLFLWPALVVCLRERDGSFLRIVVVAGCFSGRTPLGTGLTYCAAGRDLDARRKWRMTCNVICNGASFGTGELFLFFAL
jgi:hypothetical protein